MGVPQVFRLFRFVKIAEHQWRRGCSACSVCSAKKCTRERGDLFTLRLCLCARARARFHGTSGTQRTPPRLLACVAFGVTEQAEHLRNT